MSRCWIHLHFFDPFHRGLWNWAKWEIWGTSSFKTAWELHSLFSPIHTFTNNYESESLTTTKVNIIERTTTNMKACLSRNLSFIEIVRCILSCLKNIDKTHIRNIYFWPSFNASFSHLQTHSFSQIHFPTYLQIG